MCIPMHLINDFASETLTVCGLVADKKITIKKCMHGKYEICDSYNYNLNNYYGIIIT